MAISGLPGLTLSLHKTKNEETKSTATVSTVNNFNFNTEDRDRVFSPLPQTVTDGISVSGGSMGIPLKRESSSSPYPKRESVDFSKRALKSQILVPIEESPTDKVSLDFMKALIRIQTELLLDNIGLINNLKEFGNKVIYLEKDLKEMIFILMGETDVQINLEDREIKCCGCKIPLFARVKSMIIRKTVNFGVTEIASRLWEEFKISLEFCIPSP
jgi:hypothetical protein